MKKLMLLGASRYLKPVVECAHKFGIYTISCDDNPDHEGHKYTDEYAIADLIDKEAVLNVAKSLEIDGILSYACDCGVTTAAYVAEKMGLPTTGPYDSVCILQNKARFRKFLEDNGFNVPKSGCYSSYKEALEDFSKFRLPVIVKPVDSAGSKGVTRIDDCSELESAVERALAYSFCGDIIIEEFIEKKNFSSDSDCFSFDGKLEICTFSDQYFDEKSDNKYAPAGFVWPSTMEEKYQKELATEIQRLLKLLKMGTSQYNVESRVGTDGKTYIMEVAPRSGGNRIAEMIKYASETDIIEYAVKSAVGMEMPTVSTPEYKGFWAEIILHSNDEGVFEDIIVDPRIGKYLVEKDPWVSKGDYVHGFSAANQSIGTLIFNFDDDMTRRTVMNNCSEYIKIKLKK